ALAEPALTLRDSNWNIVRSNNNWKDTQQVGNSGNGTGGAKRPGGGDSCNSHCRTLHRYSFGQRWWNGDRSGGNLQAAIAASTAAESSLSRIPSDRAIVEKIALLGKD